MSDLSQTILAGTSQMAEAQKYANDQKQLRDTKKQVALQAATEAFSKVGDIFKQKQEEDDLKELSNAYSLGVTAKGAAGGLTAISAHRPRTAAAAAQKINLTTQLEEAVRKGTLNPLEEAQKHHYEQIDKTAREAAEQKAQDEKDRDAWAAGYVPNPDDDEEVRQIHIAVLTGQLSPKQAKPVLDDLRNRKIAAARIAEAENKRASITTAAEQQRLAINAYLEDDYAEDGVSGAWVPMSHEDRLKKAIAAGANSATVKLLNDQHNKEVIAEETTRNHMELATISRQATQIRADMLEFRKEQAKLASQADRTDEQERNSRISAERLSKNAIAMLAAQDRAKVLVNNDPEMPPDVKKTALAEIETYTAQLRDDLKQMNDILRTFAKATPRDASGTGPATMPLTRGKLVKNAEGRWVKAQE